MSQYFLRVSYTKKKTFFFLKNIFLTYDLKNIFLTYVTYKSRMSKKYFSQVSYTKIILFTNLVHKKTGVCVFFFTSIVYDSNDCACSCVLRHMVVKSKSLV